MSSPTRPAICVCDADFCPMHVIGVIVYEDFTNALCLPPVNAEWHIKSVKGTQRIHLHLIKNR